MIRFFKYLILLLIVACLVTIALANRDPVTLSLLPPALEEFLGMSWAKLRDIPLYAVFYGGVVVGLLIGFLWEWIREAKHRQEADKRQKQVIDLKREVSKLKGGKNVGEDDVLAILENAPSKAG